MDKLTIEEKAKRYDEALKKAGELYLPSDSALLEEIFPELIECNDEKIKEEIINYFECQSRDEPCRKSIHDKWIAWIEKQGQTFTKEEVGNANKVEPKFKAGDWVIDKQGIVHQISNVIENVTNHTYVYDIVGGGYFNDNTEGVRLWNINDAKDGDVLITINGKRPFIYKGCLDPNHPDSPVAYCGIDTKGYFYRGLGKINHWWTDGEVKPATKEQSDTLMKAMTDAGYTFDFEKKELKKISQRMISAEAKEIILKSGSNLSNKE